ncbi:MAG: helix-turn-helix domain-containing protein [Firmicutes bacterium]|nr:helix-turn-helix domain-containing protein [Bacillota bacterium]
MNFAKTILEIRNDAGLTQEEFAKKMFVTRQAVSRWENGGTTPTVDSLNIMINTFNVDANVFFKEEQKCQSCSWHLSNFEYLGLNEDGTIHGEYCAQCLQKGKFDDQFTPEAIINMIVEEGLDFYNTDHKTNYTKEQAREVLNQVLPTLKRWKQA